MIGRRFRNLDAKLHFHFGQITTAITETEWQVSSSKKYGNPLERNFEPFPRTADSPASVELRCADLAALRAAVEVLLVGVVAELPRIPEAVAAEIDALVELARADLR